jgi:hypothetical protein
MTKRFLIGLIITISSYFLYGQGLKKDDQILVNNFIDYVKNGEKDKIASLMTFPFEREYPIPSIKNRQEFIQRYNDIFDDKIKQIIIKSDASKNWSDMGWRGIMLNNGEIWLDFEGRLLGINYQSEFEKKLLDKLIEDDKQNIHPSLVQFNKPVCVLETSKFRIRIDDLGEKGFRYASWSINKPMTDKPDLILSNGKLNVEGSGGNHSYQFKNGVYSYECSIIVMGEDNSPPALLIITKGDKEVLNQRASIVRK